MKRTIGVVIAALALAGCATTSGGTAAGSVLSPGMAVMDNCQATERLVVENGTSYPVRISATDNSANSSVGSAQLIEVVQAGVVDTIVRTRTGHPKLQFDLEQPALPSGASVPLRGLKARCVALP
jgi:hypothetical protein